MYNLALVFCSVRTAAMRGCISVSSSCNGHKTAVLLRVALHRLDPVAPYQGRLNRGESCQSFLLLDLPRRQAHLSILRHEVGRIQHET